MRERTLNQLLLGTSFLVSATLLPQTAQAQDSPAPDNLPPVETTTPVSVNEDVDTIVVTGSRVRRNTFTAISPLQTITTELSNDAGLFDPASILQKSEAAAGQQIDATFNGFVLDNGPGSQTLNLRGLGASRTLVLLNGRRLAPAGVEGSPANPSINLIPGSLVERYDLLLDGASSVYGSDAVAGVSNVILRNDFDGLEIQLSGDLPEQSGGEDYSLAAAWGTAGEAGFIGFGGEYDVRDAVRLGDRDFLEGCETEYEIDENGNIRTQGRVNTDRYANIGISYRLQDCRNTGLGGRIRRVPAGLGFVYYTPGTTNVGIPNFSDTIVGGVAVDGNGDGIADVNLADYTPNGEFNDRTFISEQKRISLMAYGELNLDTRAEITPYFETLYSKAEIFSDSGSSQLFTIVPADNPFNPCNPNQPNGVDCGLAADSLLTNPNYIESFRRYNFDGANGTRTPGCGGRTREDCTPEILGRLNGALGPRTAGAGVVVRGDRDEVDITQEQFRFVGGIKGELPFLDIGSLSDWTFDAFVSYSESNGTSSRLGIRDDRLHFALGFDPNIRNETNALISLEDGPCTPDAGTFIQPDIAAGCVPVNLFAPSLFENIIGDFATQAERDYLFDSRDFETNYAQTVGSAFITGGLFDLPAGTVSAVLGVEVRKDDLDSRPDNVAAQGLFFGFFSDQGGSGDKTTREIFGEIDIPLLKNKSLFRELNVNFAGRLTDDEFYGTNGTYAIKGGWRPVDALLLKATYGTSFRAPNLRENFLLGTTGFNNTLDPCVTPADAIDDLSGSYDRAADPREDVTLENCRAEGIDPTDFSPVPNNVRTYSVESRSGGSLDLEPETSTSLTLGFAYEQPFTDWIEANFNVNYYEIRVKDTVIDPTTAFIIGDCYTFQPNRASTFCSRITRNSLTADLEPGRISLIDSGFINQDEETVRGLDFNATFGKDIRMFARDVDWGLDIRAGRLLERSSLFIDEDNGTENFDDDIGEFGFAKWTGRARLSAQLNGWRATWTTRFVQAVEQDEDLIDEFADTISGGSQTCSGPERNDVQCRDVGFADDYFTHAASIRYGQDDWSIVIGVSNIFDKSPPLVDPTEVTSISNAAIGTGYDYDGREYFASLRKIF